MVGTGPEDKIWEEELTDFGFKINGVLWPVSCLSVEWANVSPGKNKMDKR